MDNTKNALKINVKNCVGKTENVMCIIIRYCNTPGEKKTTLITVNILNTK